MTSFDVMEWWSDARFALRGMRQWPLAVCVAVATLAIGIGANTALFSVIDAVVLRPLPVAEPSRLVKLIQTEKSEGGRYAVAYHNFYHWRARAASLAEIALLQRSDVGVGDSQTVERVPGYRVSRGYFETLGRGPAVGRVFSEDAYSLGTAIPEVIVSDQLWRDRFDRAPDVLSQSLRIDGVFHSIVGVMPPSSPIESLGWRDLWLPLVVDEAAALASPLHGGFAAIGRLAPGIDIEVAQTELRSIAQALELELPETNQGWGVEVVAVSTWLLGDLRATLSMLAVSVGAILMIGAANTANLLLGRVSARRRELTIRRSLGANRYRILRTVGVEGLVVGLLAGGLGVPLSMVAVGLLHGRVPWPVPRFAEASIDQRALTVALALALLTSVACSLGGMRRALAISDFQARAAQVGRRARLNSSLVAVEVAVALVVLVASGLALESLTRLRAVDPGFVPEGLLTLRFELPQDGSEGHDGQRGAARLVALQKLQSELAGLPGVEHAALAQTHLPLSGHRGTFEFFLAGGSRETGEGVRSLAGIVSGGYFEALGIPLIEGRTFALHETWEDSRTVIVNQQSAHRLWPDGEPIGREIVFLNGDTGTVVGVVGDVRQSAVAVDPGIELFVPWGANAGREFSVALRSDLSAPPSFNQVEERIGVLFPGAQVFGRETGSDLISGSLAEHQAVALLVSVFAAVCLALGVGGIFAVAARSVSSRTREIGVRMAIGATPSEIARLMVGSSITPVAIGLAGGVVLAMGFAQAWQSLLFEVGPLDPRTLVTACLLLGAAALAAAWVPARRAGRIDPLKALRSESDGG